MRATARSAADSHGSGSPPARSETASALMPSWLAVSAAPTVPECSTDRPTLTPWLMPESTRSGFGPDGPERAGDHRERRRGIEPVGLHRLGALDRGPLVGDGRAVGDRAHGGAGAAVVGARGHHDDLVGRPAPSAATVVGPAHQGPGQRGQPGRAHPVVVGDENPHVCRTLPADRRRPGARHRAVRAPGHGAVTTRPAGRHPRPGPGLLQFTRHAAPARPGSPSPRRPGSSGASGTASQEVVVCEVGATLRAYTVGRQPGPRRLRRRRVVPLGPGSGPGPVAQPAGRRSLRVQRGAGPGRARRARAPQRHPRPGALDALDPPDPAPEPALAAPAAPSRRPATRSRSCSSSTYHVGRDGLTVTTGRQSLERGSGPLRPRLPPLPDRRARDRRRGHPARAGAPHARPRRPWAARPAASTPVEGTERDFTTSRFVGPPCSIPAFTTLDRDADGRARASLDAPGGASGAALWVDPGFPYLMVYTGDTLGEVPAAPAGRGHRADDLPAQRAAHRQGPDRPAAGPGVVGPLGHRAPVTAAP